MQRPPREETGFSSLDYQFRLLLHCDRLPQNEAKSTRENVLESLRAWSEECQRNEEILVREIDQGCGHDDLSWTFDFSRSTGLSREVLLKTTIYLSLSDLINALLMRILPLLRQARIKVHLVNPLEWFLEMIPQHLDPGQVVSVRLPDDLVPSTRYFSSFQIFNRLISLTVLNSQWLYRFERFLDHFTIVRSVSLWFNNEFNFRLLRALLSRLIGRTTRF